MKLRSAKSVAYWLPGIPIKVVFKWKFTMWIPTYKMIVIKLRFKFIASFHAYRDKIIKIINYNLEVAKLSKEKEISFSKF